MSKIFEARKAFKPFEYPEVLKYKEAIQHSDWLHTEWKFGSDVNDFKVNLNDAERSAIKNSLLAISQIEVKVKDFWGKIGDRFPKAEFKQVAYVFADSEVRHSDAYSELLDKLGLEADFAALVDNPGPIQGRVDYLEKYVKGATSSTDQNYTMNLTLFSIFIEYVSLFSQFAVIKSFTKFKKVLKDIDNVVQATAKEELLHSLLGIYIINTIKSENPEWFGEDFYAKLYRASKKAYEAEIQIVDWIFQDGELPFISKASLKELIKHRINESLTMIGGEKQFEVDNSVLSELTWFQDEIVAEVSVDFFWKKSVDYSKKVQSITAEDLWD